MAREDGVAVPRILPCGDAALTVEFGDTIDPVLNARVLAFDDRVNARGDVILQAVIETVPTYRSVTVHYDPLAVGFDALAARLLSLGSEGADLPATVRTWRIPVSYGGPHGIDLDETAAARGLTADELVRRHAAPTYRVYMIGFLPGFAYLGGLDPGIAMPRRISPRLVTPAGTISIGGVQALIGSIEAPSGWHLLGRTPMRNFMPRRDPPFLLRPGDRVRFYPIEGAEYARLDRAAAGGELAAEAVEEAA